MQTVVTKEFPAMDGAYAEVTAWVEAQLDVLACSTKTAMQIVMCLEEIFVNIAHYAYEDSQGTFLLKMWTDEDKIILEFRDHGVAFDPLAKPDPDVTLGIAERKVGGLGIYFVKKMMDEVRYARVDGENILTLVKKL